MNFLTVTGIVIFVAWAYILFLRPMVLARFPVIVTIESKLWAGSRQVFLARVASVGGVVVGFHDLVLQSGADTSTLLSELAKFVPEQYRPLALSLALILGGIALEWMRKVTKGAVGSSLPAKE